MNVLPGLPAGKERLVRSLMVRPGLLPDRLFNKIRQCNRRMIHHGERERSL
jgi:hypothetical protein